jgi:predicted TIM-barrel fold metal-dependent hydrolase
MQTKIVDIHPHIMSTDTKRYPITPLGGKRSAWSEKRHVTIEELIVAMDEAGVDKAAIVQSVSTHGYDNSYLADSVALQPQRCTGVFSVDMLAADAPEKIRYWVKERKLSGLRVYTGGLTNKQSTSMSDPKTFPGWECARELGIPVCVSLRPEGLPHLMVLIKQFPQVRIIVDHMMEPPIAEGPPYGGSEFVFDLARYGNVYLKLTTLNIRASRKDKGSPETFFPLLVKKFGASRIAWGSNYPSAVGTLKEMVIEAKSALAVLPKQDQEWIFARTAQSLYPALADK